MAFPVTNAPSAAQTAAVNPFQQRYEQQEGRVAQERQPQENRTQPANATNASGVQKSASSTDDRQVVARASNEQEPPQGSRQRGSLLDVTV